MLVKNQSVILVLVTFCLIATIFTVIPTRSQDRAYDPWADYNEDGTVDIKDMVDVAKAFGLSGDPTKNVNVTNWVPEEPDSKIIALGEFNITSGSAFAFSVPDWNRPVGADGYAEFSVLYEIWDLSPGNYRLNVSVAAITWFIIGGPYAQEHVQMAQTTLTRHNEGFSQTTPTIGLTEIKAPHFSLEFQTQTDDPNWQNIWIAINVYVYLRK